ncbi:MAG: peptide-methionine (S)-S-oxide reductase MsrA [Candidatus Eisenbacteria bacterium]|nr:peptide-methionine (S)-S-oxide reductase MsrA [Candidatus Eisenbacteria bacterium]
MRHRIASIALMLTTGVMLAVAVHAATPTPAAPAAHAMSKADFAGGCFWSEESAFEGLPGVLSAVSGYTGGTMKHPSYEDVSTGTTGHLESVEVTFDPSIITYAQLLDIYWHNIDPTQTDGQFCDRGAEYHTAIFYRDSTQLREAEASKRKIETTPQRFTAPIATQIRPASAFWPAEDYHQDFADKNPGHYMPYRIGCGRDARLTAMWGKPGRQGHRAKS